MQARYLYGNLTIRKREKGPDVWQFRWTENGRAKSVLIGTVDAERAVEYHRSRIKARGPQAQFHEVTVQALVDRYKAEEMADGMQHDTAESYRGILKNWVCAVWGTRTLESVKTMAIEGWLKSIPRSRGTRAHIRNMMHRLFNCAIGWEMINKAASHPARGPEKVETVIRILAGRTLGHLAQLENILSAGTG